MTRAAQEHSSSSSARNSADRSYRNSRNSFSSDASSVGHPGVNAGYLKNTSSVVLAARGSTATRPSGATTGSESGTFGTQASFKRKRARRCNVLAGQIVDHKGFILLTSILTVYALTGDDIRILGFEKPDDHIFDVLVCVCFLIFSSEVILSCLGKPDYFLGFFFWLDVFATASLILDLTMVAKAIDDLLSGGSDDSDDNASSLRSGRTARIGARAARVVRVLRLVRILKLYKHWYQAGQKRQADKDREKLLTLRPGDAMSGDDADSVDGKDGPSLNESRVGRKLSEMTTRRVILLILAMLMIIPSLQAEEVDQMPISTEYGAGHVAEAFGLYADGTESRTGYEEAMLHFIFYHNWFAQWNDDLYCNVPDAPDVGSCADKFYGQMFWVGLAGRESANGTAWLEEARLRESTVTDWMDSNVHVTQNWLYNYGTMPASAQELLYSSWDEACPGTSGYFESGISLLEAEIDGVVSHAVKCPDDLRFNEKYGRSAQVGAQSARTLDLRLQFWFDLRPFLRQDSRFNLGITCLIVVILVVGSLMFSYDANVMVLMPVEKMINVVEAIRANPLIALKMADDEFKAEQEELDRQNRRTGFWARLEGLIACDCASKSSQVLETVILEKTIIKLGSLLVLGFGEAGANIIGHNMNSSHSDTAGVDAMIPGTRVECVIGVVRIRNFSIANEVLQEKIMTFGNQIAEIVHGVCNEFLGAPNKNNGDTFLIIWRVIETEDGASGGGDSGWPRPNPAELSMTAFATILGALHSSKQLAEYRGHPGLQMRLGSDARVNISFGLHAGWAIEGAVGSEYKIDASYLSPTVSIASSIERATETYDVSLIVSEAVVTLCGKQMRSKCRLIDNVMIRGSKDPMELYSVDLDYMALGVECDDEPTHSNWNPKMRLKARQFMEQEKKYIVNHDMIDIFDDDPLIRSMRRRYTVVFFQYFNMGYQNYSQGQWEDAKTWLSKSLDMLEVEDGPSRALIDYMRENSRSRSRLDAPRDWKGVRRLGLEIGKPKKTDLREPLSL